MSEVGTGKAPRHSFYECYRASAHADLSYHVLHSGRMTKRDIVEGVYLKQTNERYGAPAGLIGVVHQVGTDRTGEWVFLLRYLNHPGGTPKKPNSRGTALAPRLEKCTS
jgi:hypothetical protein